MRKLMWVVTALVLSSGCGGGCKKKRNEEGTGGPPMPTGPETASGSATGSGSGSTGSAAPATTPEARAQRFVECWGAWNANDWQKFGACFATGAVVESPGSGTPALGGRDAIVKQASTDQKQAAPDLRGDVGLVVASGSTVVGLIALHGHAGEKPIGLLFGTVSHFDDTGAIDHEWAYMDALTLMRQMMPDAAHPTRAPLETAPLAGTIAVAKDDATEQANVKTLDAWVAAYNKHDLKGYGDVFADDVTWMDAAEPKDRADKKAMIANVQPVWQGLSDARITATSTWAAGDYVAAVGTFDGTNDHDSSLHAKTGKKMSLPLLLVMKIDHGKVKAGWLVYQATSLFGQLGWTDELGPAAGGKTGSGSGLGSGSSSSGSGTGSGSGSGIGSGSGTGSGSGLR